ILFAVDPSGRTAMYIGELTVNMEDSLIIPSFKVNDELIRVNDTLILDASASCHLKYPSHQLDYSWLLPDRLEWSLPDTSRIRISIPGHTGSTYIGLKVIDHETGLFNSITKKFYVASENFPPKAKILAGSRFGNTLTKFYFDSWATLDDIQGPSTLDVRWDFDGDGVWDTSFSKEKIVFHQYELPGEYYVILQARDDEGLMSVDQYKVYVSGNTNQTGYIKDKRDGQFYGTVKLGNQ
ncbi:MAG: PKD domain-containing protein, partial [Bacteroidales bacterium]|nr:PKD domain-containing protein [Bacteroidales bacterium]